MFWNYLFTYSDYKHNFLSISFNGKTPTGIRSEHLFWIHPPFAPDLISNGPLDFKKCPFTALVSLQQLELEASLQWRKMQSNRGFILSEYISTSRDHFYLKLDTSKFFREIFSKKKIRQDPGKFKPFPWRTQVNSSSFPWTDFSCWTFGNLPGIKLNKTSCFI